MKYFVLLCDGMSDHKIRELNNKTILEYANTSNFDYLAKNGQCVSIYTAPDGMYPGSDVCNLSVFGYDPKRYYTGRSPLEAASMGIDLKDNDMSFRLNLVTLSSDYKKMEDFSAYHIDNSESSLIIDELNSYFTEGNIQFYHGLSYRNLMVVRNASLNVKTIPPHDIMGKDIESYLPSGEGSGILRGIMEKAKGILSKNLYCKANYIWPWGEGKKPNLPSYYDKFGVRGSVVAAVDLIKGIGIYTKLDIINVPGANGFLDTNFEGKAEYAIKSLKLNDFVFLHVEAPDEAGHMGSVEEKIKAVENINNRMLPIIIEGLENFGDFRLLVCPDHPTPVYIRTHVSEPVPGILYGSNIEKDENIHYDEFIRPSITFNDGYKIAEYLIKGGI